MAKATTRDAEFLLRLPEIYYSEPVRQARRWLRELPKGLGLDELESKFPKGSEEYEHFTTMAIYWEIVGSLMKRGLLNKDLAFDTFLDAPPWEKFQKAVEERRIRENNPLEGENFEWVAKRAEAWVEKHKLAKKK